MRQRLRLEQSIFDPVIFSRERKPLVFPHAIDHIEPLGRARVTVIVLLEMHAIFFRFIRPPGTHDVK